MDRVKVTAVKNVFDPLVSRVVEERPADLPIVKYVEEAFPDYPIVDLAVALDGALVPVDGMTDIVPAGKSLSIMPILRGGGGKNILRIVAMIAVMVTAIAITGGAAAGLLPGLFEAGSLSASILAAGVSIVGGIVVNAILPAPTPEISPAQSGFSESPTYGWDVASNPLTEGGPWPVAYGTARAIPPMISRYIDSEGDDQYLSCLFALADHDLDSVDSMQINGTDMAYYEEVSNEIRYGDVDQPVIQYFSEVRTDVNVGAQLSGDWVTRRTDGNTVAGLGMGITMPKGSYYANDQGGLDEIVTQIDIEYKSASLPDIPENWTRMQVYNGSPVTITVPRWSGGYWQRGRWYDIEQGSTDPEAHVEGDPWTPYIDLWGLQYILSDDRPPRPAHIWRWLEAGAPTVFDIGTVEVDCYVITAAQTEPVRRYIYRDRLPADRYDIRMRFHDGVAPTPAPRYALDVWWEYYQEIVYDDFTYPGTSLLGVRALATGQISGSMPVIDCIVTRSTVNVPTDDDTWEDKPADNPAWACLDMLVNTRYGGSVPAARIHHDAFADWAQFCNDNGYTVNVYFDAIMTLRRALDAVSTLGRGNIVQIGSRFTVIYDHEIDVPVQGFLFTPGNIAKDSFSEQWLPSTDRASVIEIGYNDAELRYAQQTLEVRSAGFAGDTRDQNVTAISLVGCTDRDMAIRHANYLLNGNRLLTLTASWDADVDALGCMVGDVVEVSHDVPQWGYGGRLAAVASSTEATLDREVTLSPGTTCQITVQTSDDDRQTRTIAAVLTETTTDEIEVTAAFDPVPARFDLYALGEVDRVTKPMRVIRISRKNDMRRRVTAIEYDDAVYDDSGAELELPESISDLSMTTRLAALEVWRGGAETKVALTWGGYALKWHVWHRQTGSPAWIYDGEAYTPAFTLSGMGYGPEYEFAVNHANNPDGGEIVTLTLVGKTEAPGDVGDIFAEAIEDGVVFSWDPVTDFDLAGYEVQTGLEWRAETDYLAGDTVVPTDGTRARYVCVTAGKSGATEPVWQETGSTTDGTAEWEPATDDWAWISTAMPEYTAALTARERQIAPAGVIRIWVNAVDAFGNVSETTATAYQQCLYWRQYITVGPTTVEGDFTNLPDAVARLPEGGGRIVIKNGTYQAGGPIALPNDKVLEFEGESKAGVNIINAGDEHLFVVEDPRKKIMFWNMTMTAQTDNRLISAEGGNSGDFELGVSNVLFNLPESGVSHYAIYIGQGSACSISLVQCESNHGAGLISIVSPGGGLGNFTGTLRAITNDIKGPNVAGIFAAGSYGKNILTGNILSDVNKYGFYMTCISLVSERNEIEFRNALTGAGDRYGIYAVSPGGYQAAMKFKCTGNEVRYVDAEASPANRFYFRGIFARDIANAIVNENILFIDIADRSGSIGIDLDRASSADGGGGSVSKNIIRHKNLTDGTGIFVRPWINGMSLTGYYIPDLYFEYPFRNHVVNGNYIEMESDETSAAYTHGMYLKDAWYNSGIDNVITGCATPVWETDGIGNTINTIDGGGW